MDSFKRKLAVAAKKKEADLVIKNGKIIDVFNGELIEETIAISDGVIVGIGNYQGKQTIDAQGKYISPGFIDGHVHIESAMVTPKQFSHVVIPHGVTTVIADPHEIANVSGANGIQYMIDAAKDTLLNTYYMLPSCVPATSFENAGAILSAKDLQPFYECDNVLGLGEVMDFPSVFNQDPAMLKKLSAANLLKKKIDGHAAGISGDPLNVYLTAGITSDHECVTAEEASDRLKRGMYVMLREGSAAKDLVSLLPVITERNARRCLFVTDDKHLDDLVDEGSIDYNISLAIKNGLEPIIAYQMATLNAAECFGLQTKGAIAPGYDADLVILSDLETVKIDQVIINGSLVAKKGEIIEDTNNNKKIPQTLLNTVKLKPYSVEKLQIKCKKKTTANIIEIIPNKIITKHLIEEIETENGFFKPSVKKDQLKIAVFERHANIGNIGLGIVKGFGLTSGAIATTVAHDSHNLVVLTTNDHDLCKATEYLTEIGGGMVVVKDGNILASLPLELSGLMTTKPFEFVNEQLASLNIALQKIGFIGSFNPFLTLSFLALPVIPELKITDLGLFQVSKFTHVDVMKDY